MAQIFTGENGNHSLLLRQGEALVTPRHLLIGKGFPTFVVGSEGLTKRMSNSCSFCKGQSTSDRH